MTFYLAEKRVQRAESRNESLTWFKTDTRIFKDRKTGKKRVQFC